LGQGEDDAVELGRVLVDAGFRVVSGGLGGVMQAVGRGAHGSTRYAPGAVIGVLPTYDATTANEFVDIPICTGLNHARNLIVVATGDVVFAVGGGSGTLSEIALAWALGKPVICVGSSAGWATGLAGRPIDERRGDQVHGPLAPRDAVALAITLLRTPPARPRGF
jgi:uncharacterized protein (TIGR00725 family)